MSEINTFLNYLKKFKSGECTLQIVEEHFINLDDFHHFWHYISDEYIRSKDNEYSTMQNKELNIFIKALENQEYDKARKVSFLGESNKS